jgi:hypothetical protein
VGARARGCAPVSKIAAISPAGRRACRAPANSSFAARLCSGDLEKDGRIGRLCIEKLCCVTPPSRASWSVLPLARRPLQRISAPVSRLLGNACTAVTVSLEGGVRLERCLHAHVCSTGSGGVSASPRERSMYRVVTESCAADGVILTAPVQSCRPLECIDNNICRTLV